MKIAITGAEGFIGSHVAQAALDRGHEVTALVQYNSRSDLGWIDDIPLESTTGKLRPVLGDIRDQDFMDSFIKDQEVAINLAALIAIPHSYSAPRSYIDTNVVGSHNFLEACRRHSVERIVQLSTSEVYGSALYVPMDEGHPVAAQSPYAATKVASDQLALAYHRSFGLPVVLARPFNAFGPRQSLRAVIPSIILQALSENEAVRLGEVSSTRDFTYVQDLANGLLAILLGAGGLGETYNLGSGFELSVKDVVAEVSRILDKPLKIEIDDSRFRPEKSEVSRLFSDSSKATSDFGWGSHISEPRSHFVARLEQTIAWFSTHAELYSANVREFRY